MQRHILRLREYTSTHTYTYTYTFTFLPCVRTVEGVMPMAVECAVACLPSPR